MEHYPCTGHAPGSPIVILPGWGFEPAVMAPLAERLRTEADVWVVPLPGLNDPDATGWSEDDALGLLAEHLPECARLVGWSLGGVLAVAYADRYPRRVEALATLAANGCFVARDDWPEAMPLTTNRQFNRAFARDPETTLKRFAGLVAQGSPAERARLKALRPLASAPSAATAGDALAALAASDNRTPLARLTVPGLHLYARRDALVPAGAADAVAALNPSQRVGVLENSGHALHLDQPEELAERVSGFFRNPGRLDKRHVARSFSRAADTYDSVARLQREVGAQLLQTVAPGARQVLDLGAGTGLFTAALRERTDASRVWALDLAEGMLRHARRHRPEADGWLCADAESLPLADASLDVVFSSLAIQWCENLPALFAELARTLTSGGQVHLATLGPDTLKELQRAWQAVDERVHVNHFEPAAVLAECARRAGLVDVHWQARSRTLYSATFSDLSGELKGLGAHNVNRGRPKGLTGRARLAALTRAYEGQRTEQGLPATFDVIYLSACKPEECP